MPMSLRLLLGFLAIGLMIAGPTVSRAGDIASDKAADLLLSGDDLFNNDQIDEALAKYIEASETAESEKNNSVMTEAYAQIARCYLMQDKIDDGRPWLKKAEQIASQDDASGWSRYLGVKGRFEWKEDQLKTEEAKAGSDKAAATFKQMYEYCTAHNLLNRAVDAANMLSLTSRKSERADWAKKGIDIAEKNNLQSWLPMLWNNLGWAYDDEGRYQESLDAFSTARIFQYKTGVEESMLIADWSLGHALRKCGMIDSAMTVMRDVQKWALIRKGDVKTPAAAEWFGKACQELGDLQLIQGDSSSALKSFKAAYSNYRQGRVYEWDQARVDYVMDKVNSLSRAGVK